MSFQENAWTIARTTYVLSLLSPDLVEVTSLDTFTTPVLNSVKGLSMVVAVVMTTTLTQPKSAKEGAKVRVQVS